LQKEPATALPIVWHGLVQGQSAAPRSSRTNQHAHQRFSVATGLAWTPLGGDILFVDATRIPAATSLILTVKLGEVMGRKARRAAPGHW